MKIFISLHQYARFIFGVIAPFHLEYFIEMLYVQLIQHYKWFAGMLACYHIYIQSHIIMQIYHIIFDGVIALFRLLKFLVKKIIVKVGGGAVPKITFNYCM